MSQQFIDRFTQLDELLKKSIEVQTTNAELQIQANQLLLAIWQQRETIAGDSGLPPTLAALPSIGELPTLGGRYKYTTDILELKNQRIIGDKIIFSFEFGGAISEIIFLSSDSSAINKVYKVRVIADGKTIWNDTYNNFEVGSDYYTDMTAYDDEDGGFYVLSFNNIFFNNTVNLTIYNSTATFTKIYIKTIRRLE